jgi:hypothetical protein
VSDRVFVAFNANGLVELTNAQPLEGIRLHRDCLDAKVGRQN